MRSSACRQILVAAMAGWMTLVAIPLPVKSAQGNWIEQIAQQIREQKRLATHPTAVSAYEHYLAQLQRVQQAVAQGNTPLVQREMGRLVAIVGNAASGITDSSAKLLLASIGEVTPVEYLDDATRSRLRLIRETEMAGAAIEEPPAPPPDASYGLPAQARPGAGPWMFGWMHNGQFHPLIVLGSGVLLLVGVGVVVMALIAFGVGDPRTKKPVQPGQASSRVDEKKI